VGTISCRRLTVTTFHIVVTNPVSASSAASTTQQGQGPQQAVLEQPAQARGDGGAHRWVVDFLPGTSRQGREQRRGHGERAGVQPERQRDGDPEQQAADRRAEEQLSDRGDGVLVAVRAVQQRRRHNDLELPAGGCVARTAG
jgi:hypothetical protein